MQFKPQPLIPWDFRQREPDYVRGSDVDKRLMTWSHLEYKRLKQLGWEHRHTRIWVLRRDLAHPPRPVLQPEPEPEPEPVATVRVTSNSLAPWYTLCTPKCGYFFRQDSDNRRKKLGIDICNIPMWRPTSYGPLRQSLVVDKSLRRSFKNGQHQALNR